MGRNYMTQKYNQFFIITDIYIYINIKLEEIRTKN